MTVGAHPHNGPTAKALRVAVEAAKAQQNPFGWMTVDELLSSELGEPKWLVPALELGPGRPCGLWGYGGTGKSYVAMALALAVASGVELFGRLPVRQGRVAHLSHELGARVLKERYRRLANGQGIRLSDLGDRLIVAPYPSIYLNQATAEDAYLEAFKGFDLVVIDSFRRAIPGSDENDSTVSDCLMMLARVSNLTDCTFVVLHHTGKSDIQAKPGDGSDKRASGRGSSGIFDACGCIWLVEGAGRGPRKLTQIRAHDDGDGGLDALWIDLSLVGVEEPLYTAQRAPMAVTMLDASQLEKAKRAAARKANAAQFERDSAAVLEAIRDAGSNANMRRVLSLAGDSRRMRDTIEQLIFDRQIAVTSGTNRARVLTVVEKSDSPELSEPEWIEGLDAL
jgi:hypothetical protein